MRAGARMDTLTLDELLTRARSVLARGPIGNNLDLAAAANTPVPPTLDLSSGCRCYAWGGINHFAGECPTRLREAGALQRKGEDAMSKKIMSIATAAKGYNLIVSLDVSGWSPNAMRETLLEHHHYVLRT
uniref:Uncharacterized protein n=1 Tax=Trichuris muris TaxID=70415 RepID=A0A5S6QMR6_TRIMR